MKEADPALVADLAEQGLLVRAETHRHQYPHCWRCGTPLCTTPSPRGTSATAVADRMLELNRRIGWHPEHVRDGRFGRWLEGNVDWSISRDRYWGTPLPLWRYADCGRIDAVGSYEELRDRAVQELPEPFDPHRPYVDEVVLTCDCGGAMAREPRSSLERLVRQRRDAVRPGPPPVRHGWGPPAGRFPADFICEASTRRGAGSTPCSPRAPSSSTRRPTATSSAWA